MNPDDHVCLCFRVSLRKIQTYLRTEDPPVASLISECLGAGTGCGWCVPFLKHLHAEHQAGRTPDLRFDPERYAYSRNSYRASGDKHPDDLRDDDGNPVLEGPGEP